jgi:hypothetical protein
MATNHDHTDHSPLAKPEDLIERTDVEEHAGTVIYASAVIFGLVLFTAVGGYVYWKNRLVDVPPKMTTGLVFSSETAAPDVVPINQPRLQLSPRADMAIYRANQVEELNTYAWLNKDAGVVRIPIDRAIEVIAAKGLPTRPAEEAAVFFDQGTSAPQDSSGGRTYRNKLR